MIWIRVLAICMLTTVACSPEELRIPREKKAEIRTQTQKKPEPQMSWMLLGAGVWVLEDKRPLQEKTSRAVNWQAELAQFKDVLEQSFPLSKIIWVDKEGCQSGHIDCSITILTESKR